MTSRVRHYLIPLHPGSHAEPFSLNGALSLVLYAKGYGQKFGSTASARRPQGRGRRAHEVRP